MTTFDGRSLFRGKTLAALLAVYLVWGSTYLAIRLAIESLPTFSMAGVRYLIAGALLYGWGRLRGGKRPEAKTLLPIAVIGALLLVGGNGLVVWAEHHIPSGIAALLIATEPFWIAVLVPIVTGGRRPGLRTYAGIAIGLAGVFVLVGGVGGMGESGIDIAGALAVVLASFFWALGSLYSTRAKLPDSPWISTGSQMLAGGAMLLLLGGGSGEWTAFDPSQVTASALWAFAYLVIFGSIVAFTAYAYLLRNARPTVVSTYAFVNPIVAVLLGWWIVDEPVSGRVVVAGALILAALAAILYDEPKREVAAT
ncbi:MAG: EamA family transporter [Thermoanaerobaculia bacterium]|jgi:drug/metabolite transporter (DMT)-like permease|nr:EamA family transporter [Thermoanaerobaculia bacterium]